MKPIIEFCVDPASVELAEHFLSDSPMGDIERQVAVMQLASCIQRAVENWLEANEGDPT